MIMRGLKLQKAIRLVAEGILTESEMAAQLNVSVGTLLKLGRDPIFTRRVGQEREVLRVEWSSARERGGEQTVRGFY
jgi:orotate phosphoribosyltransferase-like protein